MTTHRKARHRPRPSFDQVLLVYLTILLLLVAAATLVVSMAMLIVMLTAQ